MKLGYTLGVITHDSEPDYDGWGPDSYWGCTEWKAWHAALEKKHGRKKANEIWLTAWEKQGPFDAPLNSCRYKTDFVNYFLSKGIDIRSFVSAIFTNTAEAVVNTSEVVANTTDSAASLGKHLKWIIPGVVIIGVVTAGVIVYKKIDTVKKLI